MKRLPALAAIFIVTALACSPGNAETVAPSPAEEPIRSYHFGNDLQDTLKGNLDALALSGGKRMVPYFKTIAGCDPEGNWIPLDHPEGWTTRYKEVLGNKTDRHCHFFIQAHLDRGALNRDAGLFAQMVRLQNDHGDTRCWVYATWVRYPGITKKEWEEIPGVWTPPIPRDQVKTWDDAMVDTTGYYRMLMNRWNEAIDKSHAPNPVRLCPVGSALVGLEQEIAAGRLPGVSDFRDFTFVADAVHLTPGAAYLVTLVHYACIFGESPEGKVTSAMSGLSEEQARALQRLAWETVINEPDSGVKAAGKDAGDK